MSHTMSLRGGQRLQTKNILPRRCLVWCYKMLMAFKLKLNKIKSSTAVHTGHTSSTQQPPAANGYHLDVQTQNNPLFQNVLLDRTALHVVWASSPSTRPMKTEEDNIMSLTDDTGFLSAM